MKKIIFIHFVLILLFLSCSLPPKNNDTKYNPKISLNNFVLDKDTVLIIYPSAKTINKIKRIKGEDFYIIADDANYYRAKIYNYLDSINKTYKTISDSVHIMYKNKNNKLVQIKNHDRDLYWYVILYKNEERKYKTISVVDFRQEYTRFFNVK